MPHESDRSPILRVGIVAAVLLAAGALAVAGLAAVRGSVGPLSATQAAAEAAAAIAMALVAWRTSGAERLAWGAFSLSLAGWAVTDAVAAASAGGVPIALGWLDVGWIASLVPLVAAVLLTYLRLRPERDLQGALDAAALALLCTLLAWSLAQRGVIMWSGGALELGVAVLYPAVDLCMLAVLGWLLLGRRRPEVWLALLVASFVVRVAGGWALVQADSAGEPLLIVGGVAYTVGAALLCVAALLCLRGLRDGAPERRRVPTWAAALPLLAVPLVVVLLPWTDGRGAAVMLAVAMLLLGVRVAIASEVGRRVEQRLAESQEHFRLLAEHASDVILRVSPGGTVHFASASAANVLAMPDGPPRDDCFGMVHPDDRMAAVAAHHRVLSGGRSVRETFRVRRGDGRLIWAEVVGDPVLDAADRITEIQYGLRDVTDRVLRQADETAMRAIAELAAGGAGEDAVHAAVARELGTVLGAAAAALVRFGEDGAADAVAVWLRDDDGERPRTVATAAALEAAAAGGGDTAPVRIGGAVWGCVWAAAAEDAPTEGLDERLHRFSDVAAVAIGAAAGRAALERSASTDPLTGLLNRRAFTDRMEGEISRARRHGRRLSLVMLDLDHFKQVNDRHGHQAGDRVLQEVAARMRTAARAHDLCARLGGEELAVLLPETDGGAAHAAAERLRAAIADVPVEDVGRVTASFGVAELDPDCDSAELYRRADAALYWSKGAGRDRVSLHSAALAEEIVAAERDRARQETPSQRALRALAWAVDERDPMSTDGSAHVATLAAMIARALGWPSSQVDVLAEAALVHDVGKVGVPDRILLRDGPLGDDERVLLQRHLVRGGEVVGAVLGERAGQWVRHIHERWDGGGYPDCLAGEAIPEGSRIIGLAAAFTAMTAARPWRPALSVEEALEECRRAAGTQFWPEGVEALGLVAPLAATRGAGAAA